MPDEILKACDHRVHPRCGGVEATPALRPVLHVLRARADGAECTDRLLTDGAAFYLHHQDWAACRLPAASAIAALRRWPRLRTAVEDEETFFVRDDPPPSTETS